MAILAVTVTLLTVPSRDVKASDLTPCDDGLYWCIDMEVDINAGLENFLVSLPQVTSIQKSGGYSRVVTTFTIEDFSNTDNLQKVADNIEFKVKMWQATKQHKIGGQNIPALCINDVNTNLPSGVYATSNRLVLVQNDPLCA